MGNPASRQFGPFLIDVEERMLRRDGELVPLTPKAFDVLVALIEKPGQLILKEQLLQKVWPDTFVEESNLAYNIFALRKALGDTAENSRYIETVSKKGYRFRASVSPGSALGNAPPASEVDAEPARMPFSGGMRDGEVTILPFRQALARSRAAVEARSRYSRMLLSNCPRCPTPIRRGASGPAGRGCGSLLRRPWSQQD